MTYAIDVDVVLEYCGLKVQFGQRIVIELDLVGEELREKWNEGREDSNFDSIQHPGSDLRVTHENNRNKQTNT